jgi:hypothetical protein
MGLEGFDARDMMGLEGFDVWATMGLEGFDKLDIPEYVAA